ncbi:MAG: glycosyltransferase family 61 protein [Rhodospirillales bacterium]
MPDQAETVLQRRPIEAFAAAGLMGPGRPVQHVHSLAPVRVSLPALTNGRHFLQQYQLRELPDQGMWRHGHYDSFAPPIFLLHDALVHSSAGIVAVGDQVISETLAHTDPEAHGFRVLAKGIAIRPAPVRRLGGAYIHLLAGGESDYYHSMMMGIARLASVPENYQAAAAGVLVARAAARTREALALLDLMPSLAIEEVGRDATLRVETLILPLSVCGESAYHPCVADFYRAISTNVPPMARPSPRRIYIDRRHTGERPLVNEAELMGALAGLGFVMVRPDMLSLADQVRLFRGAEVIVAPHGAELTNLGFCRPGTQIIELLMDAYCNWCFRNLAGLLRLRYDCVVGLAQRPWPDLNPGMHGTPWKISVNHVVAAAAQTCQQAAA